MDTLIMRYRWLGLGLTLTLLITMIIPQYKCIIMYYKYVHNALSLQQKEQEHIKQDNEIKLD